MLRTPVSSIGSSAMQPHAIDVPSPETFYQRINKSAKESTELSSASSPGTSSLKRFACQFDPGSKNGRVLVLLFDRDGDSEFKEMSRLDVLRMTRQAAVEKEEEPDSAGEAFSVMTAPIRRLGSLGAKGRRGSHNGMYGDSGGAEINYATVCDVQVCGWAHHSRSRRDDRRRRVVMHFVCCVCSEFMRAIFDEWRMHFPCRTSRRSLFESKRFSSVLVRQMIAHESTLMEVLIMGCDV